MISRLPAACRAVVALLVLAQSGRADSGITVEQGNDQVRVAWPISGDETGLARFSLNERQPLVESLAIRAADGTTTTIARGLDLAATLTVGSRDLSQPAGWVAFFDNTMNRPHATHPIQVGRRRVEVRAEGTRTVLSLAEVAAGSFRGDLRFTFMAGGPLLRVEAVVRTDEDGRAIVYDAGLAGQNPGWNTARWVDPTGTPHAERIDPFAPATPVAVAGRALAVDNGSGALAVFPEPHRYFYPQDEAYNLRFVWHGRDFGGQARGPGLGIRQSLSGDRRFTPWFNAPPGTDQHLALLLVVARGNGDRALEVVRRYTHDDKYPSLPGHKTFTSHYHVEHTLEFLREQARQKTDGIPAGLETPGMVRTFRARGVDIVHLAEFHVGETPGLDTARRLRQLGRMHAECERLSDQGVLILPGEEANVHLGGHWLSFFPRPVTWVLNRKPDEPLVETVEGVGPVYRVGSPADVLRLMESENGLMWTAHPRIKGSFGFPDRYRDQPFYRSPHFLGAAWKAMPGDLSRPTLGWRSLDLLDDLCNGGDRKQVVGEADLFRMEPEMETYAHMNINYLRLDRVPKFRDGWQPVLDALRGGRFFTSTGEILVPEFKVGGQPSGGTLTLPAGGETTVDVGLSWTFPLNYAEVVSGDGRQVHRQRVELADTTEHGSRTLRIPVPLGGRSWVRFEVWDVAGNGAFTQPVWVEPMPAPGD